MNFDYISFQSKMAAIADVTERKLALLNDTAAFYNSNNRAVRIDGGKPTCLYYATENSPGCAVGRCCVRENNPLVDPINNQYLNSAVGALISDDEASKLLPEWLREMKGDFLVNLQIFHDLDENWTPEGLSEIGKRAYDNLVLIITQKKNV